MNKIIDFIKLVRYKNLVIIILVQSVTKFFLINPYVKDPTLTNLEFIIFLFSLLTIVAGGYIINDIYDIENDKINKPEKRIVDLKINKSFALKAYYLLNFIGMSSSFYLSLIINKIWYCLIFLFFIYSLWKYSKNYKSSFILGNLQVAFLTSMSIFTLAIYDIVSKGNLISNGTKMVFIIIIIYCGFSFITTLMREILKDIEDIEGDRRNDANTLAIKYDINKTKKIVSILTWIPIVGIGYFQYFQYSVLNTEFSVPLSYWGVNIYSVTHMFVLQLLLFFLLYKIYFAKSKLDFHYTSTLCKIIMLVGILVIPLNYFLHI